MAKWWFYDFFNYVYTVYHKSEYTPYISVDI